ncbi:HupE/UreJ family protein [Psychrobacillus sp. NPDC058041]|uniref:HupE/UreJ family protein n=1 Tax=Psychrobacillus sp. NPDC058041 TaxID=3346310 RepID=UPI0036DAD88F
MIIKTGTSSRKKLTFFSLIIFLLFMTVAPLSTFAHPYSASYTDLKITAEKTEMTFIIDTQSIIELMEDVDLNKDGKLEKSELDENEHHLEELVTESLALDKGAHEMTPTLEKMELVEKDNKQFLKLTFTFEGFLSGDTIILTDGFYVNDSNTNYVNLVTVAFGDQKTEAVLQGSERSWTMLLAEEQIPQGEGNVSTPTPVHKSNSSWFSFFKLGMLHILTGYDHLLFLIALLLRKQTLKQYIGIVTAFTVAHSITLSLSVLDIVNLPSLFVESVIALSIVYVALENIFRKKIQHRWGITFAFGLIHGLGFADLLKEMALPKSHLAIALVSFNVGIEVIQLSIVLICLPILFYLHKQKNSLKLVQVLSAVIVIAGAYFLVNQLL